LAFGRPGIKWEDIIKVYYKELPCENLAQGRVHCRVLVKPVEHSEKQWECINNMSFSTKAPYYL
jgi:hypothetical protein